MKETAKYETPDNGTAEKAVNDLQSLDLPSMSYIQLVRLQNALQTIVKDVDHALDGRTNDDNSGDTVRVPSAKL